MNILDAVDAASLRKDIPQFRAGDELKIHVRVIEGNKSRLQVFQYTLSLHDALPIWKSVV